MKGIVAIPIVNEGTILHSSGEMSAKKQQIRSVECKKESNKEKKGKEKKKS